MVEAVLAFYDICALCQPPGSSRENSKLFTFFFASSTLILENENFLKDMIPILKLKQERIREIKLIDTKNATERVTRVAGEETVGWMDGLVGWAGWAGGRVGLVEHDGA